MLPNYLQQHPQETYKGIVDIVKGIFDGQGLILTGSAKQIIDGTDTEVQTKRPAHYIGPEGEAMAMVPLLRDIDLLVVSRPRQILTSSYFSDKAKAIGDRLPLEQRMLLDLTVATPDLFRALESLGTSSAEYEEAQKNGDLGHLIELRSYRMSIVNGLLYRAGFMYAPSNNSFVNCSQLPVANLLHGHTTAIAAGMGYEVLSNPGSLADKVIEAAKRAYTPEEIEESNAEAKAMKGLKNSEIEVNINPPHIQIFLLLARAEGFNRKEAELGRKVRGLWDRGLDTKQIDELKHLLKGKNPQLYGILYRQ